MASEFTSATLVVQKSIGNVNQPCNVGEEMIYRYLTGVGDHWGLFGDWLP